MKRKRTAKQKLAAARAVLEGASPTEALGTDDQPKPRQLGESYVEEPMPPADGERPACFPPWWLAQRGH